MTVYINTHIVCTKTEFNFIATIYRHTPIYEKGSKSQASNYIPISLTSKVVKVLESTIRDCICSFLTDNKLLTAKQHGFSKAIAIMPNAVKEDH